MNAYFPSNESKYRDATGRDITQILNEFRRRDFGPRCRPLVATFYFGNRWHLCLLVGVFDAHNFRWSYSAYEIELFWSWHFFFFVLIPVFLFSLCERSAFRLPTWMNLTDFMHRTSYSVLFVLLLAEVITNDRLSRVIVTVTPCCCYFSILLFSCFARVCVYVCAAVCWLMHI